MAAAVAQRDVEINLRAVSGAISDLPAAAEDPAGWDYWMDDWPDTMARFEWLADLARDGQLEAAEQAEYERLLGQLGKHLPLAERLGLPVPEKVRRAMLRGRE